MPGKHHLDSVTGADVCETPILMKKNFLGFFFLKGKKVRFDVNFPLPCVYWRVEPRMKQAVEV